MKVELTRDEVLAVLRSMSDVMSGSCFVVFIPTNLINAQHIISFWVPFLSQRHTYVKLDLTK